MVSQDISLEDVSNRTREMAFPESVVQYLWGNIGAPPGVSPKTLRFKVLKSRNIDTAEGRPRADLGDYNYNKATK